MLKIIRKNLKHTWFYIVLIIVFLVIQAVADLNLPDYTSKIVNVGIQEKAIQNGSPDFTYIFLTGLEMLGVTLISMFAAIMITFLSAKMAATVGKLIREKVYKKVLSFSSTEFRKFGSSSLITRNTNDVQQIQNLFPMLFRVVVYAPIMGIGAFHDTV